MVEAEFADEAEKEQFLGREQRPTNLSEYADEMWHAEVED